MKETSGPPDRACRALAALEEIQSEYIVSGMCDAVACGFSRAVVGHFKREGRALPWRRTCDPYRILVSEIMLQQTQVSRVTAKYLLFTKAFPDFRTLHAATLEEVLSVWQGLGYNRRAIALKRIAAIVTDDYGGRFPEDPAAIGTFPGIGRCTATAIGVYAFGRPGVFIETNIRRTYIHCFFPGRESVRDSEIIPLVVATIDEDRPREFFWGLMDIGTLLSRLATDPNHRSARYRKQPAFTGSRRQKRGAIISALVQGPCLVETLAGLTGIQGEELGDLLRILAGEGFLETCGDMVRLMPGGPP
jgi:A/G-specific adenine glycosylase